MLVSFSIFTGVLVVVLIWVGGLTFAFFKAYQTYRQLTADIDKKDVAHILKMLKQNDQKLQKDVDQLSQDITQLTKFVQPHIQKMGFVRYNPFGNTGGDQSFCLCLLDGRDNGILLTSLHARQQTRLYTKEIEAGVTKDGTKLSKEEEKCLQIAQKWSNS